MKTMLTILFIFFLNAVCTDTVPPPQIVINNDTISNIEKTTSMGIDLRNLNSQIQLTRCQVLKLSNEHDINLLEKEYKVYGQSWEEMKNQFDSLLLELDSFRMDSLK